jgi:hypothetical protein
MVVGPGAGCAGALQAKTAAIAAKDTAIGMERFFDWHEYMRPLDLR